MTAKPARSGRPGRFFATAAKGTEALLAEELAELGLARVHPTSGGVRFGQAPADAHRACLWSRIALRVHEPLARFECRSADDLYAGVRSVDWSEYLGGNQTLAVRAAGSNRALTHTQFVALKAKDAIVDQLRERHGRRPDVSRDDPDVLLFVHVQERQTSVHLDYSGGSLHERGFRAREGTAPLRETLAAALVRFSRWDGDSPLVDPLCGSGMLLLEAAAWAGRRAPGLSRARFGFERWSSFDAAAARALSTLRDEARAAARPDLPPLFGSDADARALAQARDNARAAGIRVQLQQLPLARVAPAAASGGLLANPPYGQRLEAGPDLERDLHGVLARFSGYQRALIVPVEFPKLLRASAWQAVFNGPIACELRRYDANDASVLRPGGKRRASGQRNATALEQRSSPTSQRRRDA